MADLRESFLDPLRLNLERQTQKLLDLETPFSASLKNAASRTALLDVLSNMLSLPQYTELVASLFRPLLVDLSARWLHQTDDALNKFEALSMLLEIYPELYPYAAKFIS